MHKRPRTRRGRTHGLRCGGLHADLPEDESIKQRVAALEEQFPSESERNQAMSDQNKWKEGIALITGASSGIGEGVALVLAEMGMKVAISARRVNRLEELAPRLTAAGVPDVLIIPMDMRNEQDILNGFQKIESHQGRKRPHQQCRTGCTEPLMSGATEAWRNMLEVNVLALAIATREALGQMEKHGGRATSFTSSMSGYRITQGSGVPASKHAVRAVTEDFGRTPRRWKPRE